MTVPLQTQHDMRETDARGVPRAEAARELGVSRNTVSRYADMADMPPAPPLPAPRARPSLEGHEARVDSVLSGDLGAPRRRRHTARRTCDRLVAERGYSGSYSSVCRHVAERGRGRASAGDGSPGLEWPRAPRRSTTATSRPTRRAGGRRRTARPHAAAPRREVLRRRHVRALRVPLRRPPRDLRAGRPGADDARARQRDRGRQEALRRGRGVRAVLRVPRALPPRQPPPRPPPTRATRRARSRTPWGSRGATRWCRCPGRPRPPSPTPGSPRGAGASTRAPGAATGARRPRRWPRTSPRCPPCRRSPSTR